MLTFRWELPCAPPTTGTETLNCQSRSDQCKQGLSPQTPAGCTQSGEMDSTRVPNEKRIVNNSQTVRSSNQCGLQRSKGGEILTHDLTQAIASMFNERPLISCKGSCQHCRIARPSCLPIPPDRLVMKKWNLRWFSNTLNQSQKHEQVVCLTRTACRIRKRSCAGCQNMITVDESRFFMDDRRDSIWVGQLMQYRKESVGNRHRTMSVHGIHSLVNVLKRRPYHSAFLCHAICPSLAGEICSHSGCKSLKGDDIRRENAPTQNSVRSIECVRVTKDKQKPHPAQNPDRAPTDFFFEGYMKEKLTNVTRRTERARKGHHQLFQRNRTRNSANCL
jgi:hypothetical protein